MSIGYICDVYSLSELTELPDTSVAIIEESNKTHQLYKLELIVGEGDMQHTCIVLAVIISNYFCFRLLTLLLNQFSAVKS